jgi:Holliday junction DNA helicase RuvB
VSPRHESLSQGGGPSAGDGRKGNQSHGGLPGNRPTTLRPATGPPGGRDGDAASPAPLPSSDGRRPVDPVADPVEAAEEVRLRPRRLEEFVGQRQIKEHLGIVLEAARRRGQAVDHLLFAGPPGLGKTTMAGIVAGEMGVSIRITSGPALVRGGDLAAILNDLRPGDVLFIDEIHRLNRAVEEILYPAMEDFQLDIVIGKGPTARSLRLDLPRFTLVGATTRTGLVTGPLRDRFGLVARLDYYAEDELEEIVHRAARIFSVPIDEGGAAEIASRSRGTPRIANRLLRRVRDFVEVRGEGTVTREAASAGLDLFGVDQLGLDKVDRAILDALCRRFGGRPVGLSTLAVAVGEEPDTVEDAYEPFLLQRGLLQRTARGRLATPAAWAHLGLGAPARGEAPPSLFG